MRLTRPSVASVVSFSFSVVLVSSFLFGSVPLSLLKPALFLLILSPASFFSPGKARVKYIKYVSHVAEESIKVLQENRVGLELV